MNFLRNRKERKKEKRRIAKRNKWMELIHKELPVEIGIHIFKYVQDYHNIVLKREILLNKHLKVKNKKSK